MAAAINTPTALISAGVIARFIVARVTRKRCSTHYRAVLRGLATGVRRTIATFVSQLPMARGRSAFETLSRDQTVLAGDGALPQAAQQPRPDGGKAAMMAA